MVFPLLLWSGLVILVRILGHRTTLRETLIHTATAVAPIIALVHLSKGMAKINSWAGYLPLSLGDSGGLTKAEAILSGLETAPGYLLPFHLIGILAIALGVSATVYAWHLYRDHSPVARRPAQAAVLMVGLMYVAVLVTWPIMH